MENVLFLRGVGPYKINLFSKLTKEFQFRKIKCTNLSFDNLDKYLYNNFNIESFDVMDININKLQEYKKYSQEEIKDMILFEEKYNTKCFGVSNKEKLKDITKIFLEKLKILDNNKNLDTFIMWNNNFLFDRIAFYYAQKNNKQKFILEQGSFRPFTLAVDNKGVNFESSIPKNKKFYDEILIDNKLFNNYLNQPIIAKQDDNIYYDLFDYKIKRYKKYIRSIIFGDSLETKPLKINKILISEIKKLKFDLVKKFINFGSSNINIKKDRYIFVPFQVETDSQIIYFSPKIKTMKELVLLMDEKLREYNNKFNDDLKLIFKSHPKDKRINMLEINKLINSNKNLFLVTKGDTDNYINNSELVITINSTVGIEALMKNKRVITLGKAYYNIDDIVLKCFNYDKLPKYIDKALNSKFNQELLNKLLFFLRFKYFIEIYWENADHKSIIRLADHIIDKK